MTAEVSICIPARGAPDLLAKSIESIDANANAPEKVRILVCLDDDDPSFGDITPASAPRTRCGITYDIGPRLLTVGEKYNRLASICDSELLAYWADDNIILTQGWDTKIRDTYSLFDDGVALIYGQQRPSPLPGFLCASRKFVDLVGYFAPPWFPNWWSETWLDEIGHMIGRILWMHNFATQPISEQKTRGLKEIGWWAAFFDETRPVRWRKADEICAELYPPWRVEQLVQARMWLRDYFEKRNAGLRDGETVAHLEKHSMAGGLDEERYAKIRARAVDYLKELRRAPPSYRET